MNLQQTEKKKKMHKYQQVDTQKQPKHTSTAFKTMNGGSHRFISAFYLPSILCKFDSSREAYIMFTVYLKLV